MTRSFPSGRQRGIALIIVLWFVALLSILALGFTKSMRSEVQIGHNLVAAVRARHLARAALEQGLADLLQRRARATAPILPEQPHAFQFNGAELTYYLEDEQGKVNINLASRALIRGLLRQLHLDPERADSLSDAILDWRDANDLRRLNGAEATDYRAAGLPPPGNRPFQQPEELLQVMGMDADTYHAMAPYITIYSNSAKINPRHAWATVLRALPGVSESRVEAIEAARRAILEGAVETPVPSPDGTPGSLTRARGPAYTIQGEALLPGGVRAALRKVVWITAAGREMSYHVLHSDLEPAPRPDTEQEP